MAKQLPPEMCPLPVEKVLDRTMRNLQEIAPAKFTLNFSRQDLHAVKSLGKDGSIVIKQADKGSGITIVDTTQYIQEGTNHLSDRCTYERIDYDYSKALTNRINMFLKQLEELPQDLYLALRKNPEEIRTQKIYFLRKVHKSPHDIRPIVSGVGGPTEFISGFVDVILRPYIQYCPHIAQDSAEVIRTLETTTFTNSCLLATVDVKSMYLRIPQLEGIDRVLDRVYSHPKPPTISRQSLERLLTFILKDNIFDFNKSIYRQVSGIAMGTRCAPTFANLYMASLEEDFFLTRRQRSLPLPSLWLRFLDDVLIVWEGPQLHLQEFARHLNHIHNSIKFTISIGINTVEFLDLKIHKGIRFETESILDIAPYSRACHTRQYLHFHSCHPRHTFRGIVRGEVIRHLRNCSDVQAYERAIQLLFDSFMARAYPLKMLKIWTEDLPFSRREEFLYSTARRRTYNRLVWNASIHTPYHPGITRKEIKQALTTPDLPFVPTLQELPRKTIGHKLVSAKVH